MASRNARESVFLRKECSAAPKSFLELFSANVWQEFSSLTVLCEAWQRSGRLSSVRFEPGFMYRDGVLSFTHCVQENGANGKQYLVTVQQKSSEMCIRIDFVDPITAKAYQRVFQAFRSPLRVEEQMEFLPENLSEIPQLDLQHALEVVLKKIQKTPNKAVLTR